VESYFEGRRDHRQPSGRAWTAERVFLCASVEREP